MTTRVNAGGDGTFRVVFSFDKEFVDVVRSSPDGRASLEQLAGIAGQFSGSGWRVLQSQPAGGIKIDIARDFDDPQDLQRSIAQAETKGSGQSFSFLSVFHDFSITHSSSFLRSSARVSGTVDMTPGSLVPGAAAGKELQAALEQAARNVLSFRVRLELPGRISSYEGDPEAVSGGTISWTVPFGSTLRFEARSSGLRTSGLLAIVVPLFLLALAAGTVLILRLRRSREPAVAGWDMKAPDEPQQPDATQMPDAADVPEA